MLYSDAVLLSHEDVLPVPGPCPFSFASLDHPPGPGSNTAGGQRPEAALPRLRGAVPTGWTRTGSTSVRGTFSGNGDPCPPSLFRCAVRTSAAGIWTQRRTQRRKRGSQSCPRVSEPLARAGTGTQEMYLHVLWPCA